MFAVLKTGGKQYKVSPNDVIIVEKLSATAGDLIQFEEIFMISDKEHQIGTPLISGAAVHAEVIEQAKSKKVTSFVKRRRKHSSQRTKGHRQNITVLRIKDILLSGAKSSGAVIETGASIIGSSSKDSKKPVAKAEVAKKSAVKAEVAKKPDAKADAAKKPAAKTKIAKKLASKAEGTKKPVVKADVARKTTETKKK